MTSAELSVLVGVIPPVKSTIGAEQLARLERAHPRVRVEVVDDDASFEERLPGADGALVWPSMARLLAPALERGGRLRWVHSLPAGVEGVLTPELRAAEHVAVTSSKGPMGPLMAEHVLMLMLALARDLPGFLQDQAQRRWVSLSGGRTTRQLFGKTVLVMGVGEVGANVARACAVGFGMRVLGFSRARRDCPHVERYVERAELHAAFGEADFVALCLALTAETERIVDAAALAAMKPTAYLVNVARGKLVDEAALAEALRAGRIAGAGLDVAEVEPLPPESPLWTAPNVIVTPHIAPARDRFTEHLVDFWCENVRRFAEGEPLRGVVDRRAGY